MTVMALPEDLVREVLLRVKNTADLFHCARTCKPWSRLVADIRRRRSGQRSSFLSGFFSQKGRVRYLVPTPGSLFGPDRRYLGAFTTTRDLSRATPLAARHGLLLVSLLSSDAASSRIIHLAVCNLLAGTCDELPPLEINRICVDSGYAILTDADCSSSNGKQQSLWPRGYPTLFKVQVICSGNDQRPCILHTFSYNEGRWNKPTRLSRNARNHGPLKHSDAVVCQGTAHWLVGYNSVQHCYFHNTINVDAETCNVSLTKMVIPTEEDLYYDQPQLCVTPDETLSLRFLQRTGLQVIICMPQGSRGSEDDDVWLCSLVLELKPPKEIREDEDIHFTILGEKSGMVLVKDNCMNVYVVDLNTGVMKSLMDCGKVTQRKVVPFEIYWPTF